MVNKMVNSFQLRQLIYGLSVFTLILFVSCSGHSKPDPQLEEAFRIHKEALQVEKEARDLLEKLPEDSDAKSKIEARLRSWDENLIEVPGFEHDHSHDHHGHDHSHGSDVELAPEDMLAVQKVLLDSVTTIREDLQSLQPSTP